MTAAPQTKQESEDDLKRMSLGEHLEELRRRLVRALLAVALAVAAVMPFKQQVTSIYERPYRAMWAMAYDVYLGKLYARETPQTPLAQLAPEVQKKIEWNRENAARVKSGDYAFPNDVTSLGGFSVPYTLKALDPLADFWTYMAATLLFALILSSPVVLWQVWAFIAAGLYRHERAVVHRYVPFAFTLLAGGVLFGYYVLVPVCIFFLVQMMEWTQVEPMFSVSTYFGFLFTLTAALGAMFQTPLVMLALTRVGIFTHQQFKQHWRYVIMTIVVLAALVTPPDPFSMTLMALPMIVLYGFGLVLTARSARRVPQLA
jgi:sec-independent protein translocase protein TatC